MNDLLCAARFCALEPEEDMPDYSILSRFRTQMTKHGAFDKLLGSINKQLEKTTSKKQLEQKGLMIKTVTKVDASITATPRKPKGKITHEVDNDNQPKRYYPPSVDADANWSKKAGKTGYGFKKYIITDDEGLAVDVKTTSNRTKRCA